MKVIKTWGLTTILAIVLQSVMTAGAGAQTQTMTLREVMTEAVANNVNLRALEFETKARSHDTGSARGRFLPSVRANANLTYFDDDLSTRMDLSSITDILGELATIMPESSQEKIAGLSTNQSAIQIRDQLTYKASVTVAQPLTALYAIWFNYDASAQNALAGAEEERAARLRLEMDVVSSYHGVLAAIRMTEAIEAGLRQVTALEERARVMLDSGRIEPNALMLVQVQRAELSKALFAAQKSVAIGKNRLNLMMGRDLATGFDLVFPEELVFAEDVTDELDELLEQAVMTRPDLKAARHSAKSVKARYKAAVGAFLPEVTALFSYEYSGGMGMMQKESQYFGGLGLNWNAWDWGVTYFQTRATKSRERAAHARVEGMTENVRIDVRARMLEGKEAQLAHEVMVSAREQAGENLRIETEGYEAGRTTTADLLSAQTLDVRAASDLIVASMELSKSRYFLRGALGQDLLDK